MFDYPSITEICRYLEAESGGGPDAVFTGATGAAMPLASPPPVLFQPRHFAAMAATQQLTGQAAMLSLVTAAVCELLGEAVAADVPLMAAGEDGQKEGRCLPRWPLRVIGSGLFILKSVCFDKWTHL